MENTEKKISSNEPSFFVKYKKQLIVLIVVLVVCLVSIFGIALFIIFRGFLGFQNTTTDFINNNIDYLNELEDLQRRYRENNQDINNEDEVFENNQESGARNYKEYLLENLKGEYSWIENDVTGNTMNDYTITLNLGESDDQYMSFASAYVDIENFLLDNGWTLTDTKVEGNALVTQVYENLQIEERSIVIKMHSTVGSPSLEVRFNYLNTDKI